MTDKVIQARAVACPKCGARPGEPCDTQPISLERQIAGASGRSHPERFDAANAVSEGREG